MNALTLPNERHTDPARRLAECGMTDWRPAQTFRIDTDNNCNGSDDSGDDDMAIGLDKGLGLRIWEVCKCMK